MILRVAFRSMLRHWSRTLLALAGICVAAALLLDMTMLASGLTDSFGELTRAQGFQLRVTPRGTLPFDSEAGIQDANGARREILGVDGVEGIAPALGAQLYLVVGDSAHEPVFSTGIDPGSQMIYLLTDGRDPAAGEVVVSQPLAEAYKLVPGDTLRLAPSLDAALGIPRGERAYRVAGTGDFLYDFAGQRSLAIGLNELQRLTDRPDEVSLFAVAASVDVDEAEVAAEIESRLPQVSAFSTSELMQAMDERLLYFRQLATILGGVALVVTAFLIATIVTISVRERFGELATLRAIGVARRRLLGGIVLEGLMLATVGCALGLPLGAWMAGRLDSILLTFPGIPARVSFFVFDPVRVLLAFGIVIAVGALAGLLPGVSAMRTPLARALREEAE